MDLIPHKKILTELDRLSTFKSWPFAEGPCNPSNLAKAGFFYAGKKGDDSVRCFVCFKELCNWNENDDPFTEHKIHSEHCEFVKIGQDQSKITLSDFLKLLNLSLKKVIVSWLFFFNLT